MHAAAHPAEPSLKTIWKVSWGGPIEVFGFEEHLGSGGDRRVPLWMCGRTFTCALRAFSPI